MLTTNMADQGFTFVITPSVRNNKCRRYSILKLTLFAWTIRFFFIFSDPCIIRGDPHMETLDTKNYMYGGKGSYYLVFDTTSNFNIIGEFFMCRENHPHVSCLDVLIINYDNYTIKLERVNNVYVDVGPKILPYVSDDEKINIFKIPEGIKVELANGISIFWDGKKYARINIPISFQGIIMGKNQK